MKQFVFFLFILLSLTQTAAAQESWVHSYKGEGCECVKQTSDGGYIAVGNEYFGEGHSGDVLVVKTNSSGDTIWTRIYGGEGVDLAEDVFETSDHGYVVVGYSGSFGVVYYDFWLLKLDKNGDTAWTRTYGFSGADVGYSVFQTKDKGFILAGSSGTPPASDACLVKTDSLGELVWNKFYGGSNDERFFSMDTTLDGGYILAGWATLNTNDEHDAYLVKTDSAGDTVWTRTYGGRDWDYVNCIKNTPDGGFIAIGQTESISSGPRDIWLLRLDSLGDTSWTRTYGGIGSEGGSSVAPLADRGYIIVGDTACGEIGSDIWLIRTDSSGDTLWSRILGMDRDDHGRSVQVTSDGGYIVGCSAYSFGNRSFLLIKTDSAGSLPLEISPTYCYPDDSSEIDTVYPTARFSNLGTKDSISDFYCCCKIRRIEASHSIYYDQVRVGDTLGPWKYVDISFDRWIADTASEYEATFWAKKVGGDSLPTNPLKVRFNGVLPVGTGENLVVSPGAVEINSVGNEISIKYSSQVEEFRAHIFDASGRKIDEICSSSTSGIVRWGEGKPSGVYFIRVNSKGFSKVHKVILTR